MSKIDLMVGCSIIGLDHLELGNGFLTPCPLRGNVVLHLQYCPSF